ncbi:MAG: hypothetical protein GX901_10835 [Lentisphaerae bacterium]|nr:hypothetical protein [Lentisphaerota bacterium]
MNKTRISHTILVKSLCAVFAAIFLSAARADLVQLRRSVMNLTTCAFEEDEMRRLFEYVFQQRRQTQGWAKSFAQEPEITERPTLSEKNRLSAYWHWQADLLLDESQAGEYLFSCSQEETPWAVYLDGEALCGWHCEPELLSLPAGVFRLQFIAVQEMGQNLPRLRIFRQVAGGLQECQPNLQKPQQPEYTRLPKTNEKLAEYIKTWKTDAVFHFLETDQYLAYCRKTEAGDPPEGTGYYIDAAGEKQELPEQGELLLPAAKGMQLEWRHNEQSQSFAALPQWPLARPLHIRLQLQQISRFLAASEALELQLAAPWHNELPKELQPHWKLRGQYYDDNGAMLANIIITDQYKELLNLKLELPDKCRTMSISAEIGGIAVAKKLEIALLKPQNFKGEISFNGKYILEQGKIAVLRCKPLAEMKIENRSADSETIKVALFDDNLGNTQSQDETAGKRRRQKTAKNQKKIRFMRISLEELPGAEAQIPSLAALHKMLEQKPHMAMINLGEAELRAGYDALSWSKQLLYMCQVCLDAEITPVIVTLPELSGISHELARQSALLSKEMALDMKIPVADLYSQSIMEEQNILAWTQSQGLQHRSINAKGREWMNRQMRMALQKNK